MKSFTTLKNLFTNLSQNTTSANDTLGGQLISDQHRYTIQKYFDNERTVTTTTVGSQSLTTTASLANGATSATLIAAWTHPTGYSPTNFSNGDQRNVLYTNGSTAISWSDGLSSAATTAITSLGFQYYNIPQNVSKIINDTITIGQQRFTPKFLQTRAEWDLINFLPYNSDIPNYCFIYNGQLGIFPIPSTTGNVLTFNYKTKVADMTFADYSTGHIAAAGMTAGSTAVTGLSTSWSATGTYPTGVDITYYNLYLRADPPFGDGIWYLIRSFTDDTHLTLVNPVVNAPNITSSTTYTIGQFPLLSEDFHDMLVYGALKVYFGSVKPSPQQYKMFEEEYQKRLELLEDYAGTKNVNVNLADQPIQNNPNLYIYANS